MFQWDELIIVINLYEITGYLPEKELNGTDIKNINMFVANNIQIKWK
jgi:hypothetical protein